MKIESQVCTLEQAKKLKQLGVIQNSHFSWCGDEELRLMDNGKDGVSYSNWVFISETTPVNNMQADHRVDVPSAKPFAAAFTVAELGVMLGNSFQVDLSTLPPTRGKYYIYGTTNDFDYYDTEAQARAAKLIDVIERDFITVKEVNQRLK